MLKGFGRTGELTVSLASHQLLQTHGPSECRCFWVAPKEGRGSGKHPSCFSELGSVSFQTGIRPSTLEHEINPISWGSLGLTTPEPGWWVRMGSQNPDCWGCCRWTTAQPRMHRGSWQRCHFSLFSGQSEGSWHSSSPPNY